MASTTDAEAGETKPEPGIHLAMLSTPGNTANDDAPYRSRRSNGCDAKFKCLAVVVAVGAFLLILLIGLSFADLGYNEYGFVRTKTTGSVDTSYVYGPGGRHVVGPDKEFKKFKADGHYINFNRLTVFTSNKLIVTVTAHCQYFLRKKDLPLLHKQFDIYYEPILERNAKNGLKNAASQLSREEFVQNRSIAERILFEGVQRTLGGECCAELCEERNNCVSDCKNQSRCIDADKGLFADVRYFQLTDIEVPDDVQKNYLRAIVVSEEGARERYLQEVAVAEKETFAKVKLIDNQAAEIAQNATAEASLIRSKARAQSTAVVEKARSDGLKGLYQKLGLTSQEHKSSFDYLRTLQSMDNVHLSIDFNQLILYNGPRN